ncbi:MAG TPA: DNA-binding protein [Geobacter sp.]|nr:DNA-binding protein [Geobacter sp.]
MSQSNFTPTASTALLNEQETATRIGMSVHWLRRARWAGGGIPFVKMGSGPKAAVRYRPEDADAYVSARVRRSTSDPGKEAA